MKRKDDRGGLRRIVITFLKDQDIIHKEIRVRANFLINRGMKSRMALAQAAKEVNRVQNTHVMTVSDSPDLEPISDLVMHVAQGRDYKFTNELIR